jgi:transcriptional regulator with XRE-family HTH domain
MRAQCKTGADQGRGVLPNINLVADRMGIGKSRVSQIERGRVSTREVLDRYVEALGGRLSLMADFGDELLRVG